MAKWLLHWFASYSIQYFGTYYIELRHRNSQSVNRSVSRVYMLYTLLGHLKGTYDEINKPLWFPTTLPFLSPNHAKGTA